MKPGRVRPACVGCASFLARRAPRLRGVRACTTNLWHKVCQARQGSQLVHTCCGHALDPNEFYMTLGNGYLGPRIDEERSEMRYLV